MRVVLAVIWLLMLCLTVNAQETVQRFDTNADGQIDQWEYYEADALTRLEKDRDYDQRVGHWVTYQDGKAVQAEFGTNGSGTADQREFYDAEGAEADQWHHYAAEGHVERIEYDQTGDGKAGPVGALQGRQR